ncbi:MAG: hypothetical protein IK083_01010 [Abditibacteriota bacterium]|nr:hypothetical protein [Abditibacteriota bacterium]
MKLLIFFLQALLLSGLASGLFAVTDSDLKEKVTRPRWLSIPMSRIVLNPTGISHTGALVPHLSEGAMASSVLNAGYFYGEYPERVPDIWSWKPVAADIGQDAVLSKDSVDLTRLKWRDTGSAGVIEGAVIHITQQKEKYGFIESEPIQADLSRTPLVFLNIEGDDDVQWGIKAGLEGEHDVDINAGCHEKGLFVFDLRKYLPDTGGKKIYLRLFTIGKPGCKIDVSDLTLGSIAPGAEAFEKTTLFWQPSQITTACVSDTRHTSLRQTTWFADADTVVQRTIVTAAGSDLQLQGAWSKGSIIPGEGYLILRHPAYSLIVGFSGDARPVLYDDLTDYLSGKPSSGEDGTFWTVRFGDVRQGDMINTSALFVPGGQVTDELIDKARSYCRTDILNASLENRVEEWDELLSGVPMPQSFGLTRMPELPEDEINGFTSEERYERMYYKAWTFLMQDLLPPQPENGYDHVQFACGKPSLWSEGHPAARASAQWESVIAVQFAAYVMPDEAWDSLAGIISLADEQGSIGGEGLPSRHCQSAWILYSLTGDKEKLAELYPGMKKILEWKSRDPRWIYKDLTDPAEKDIEFVTHALTDMGYMMKICNALKNGDTAYFTDMRSRLYEDMVKWFWKERGGDAHRVYRSEPMGAHNTWTLVALSLAYDILGEPEKKSLLALFDEKLERTRPLLLENFSKHPSRQLLMRGLYWCGRFDDAVLIAESTLRDITEAGEFAESYNNGGEIRPEGVVPSIFGCANVIDSCMWLNNLWLSEGKPMAVILRDGGVSNLNMKNGPVHIWVEGDRLYVWGQEDVSPDFETSEEGIRSKTCKEHEVTEIFAE